MSPDHAHNATTDTTAAHNAEHHVEHGDYLIRGRDYVARQTDFKLVGREKNLEQLAGILMRKNANSVLMSGPGGVGITAICMGLQASKDQQDAPFDIVGKRFFWLDTDGLFSSGDPSVINEGFHKALKTLSRNPDTVLVIEDMKDFTEAARNNGCTNLINALCRDIRHKKFQAVFETRDDDLDAVLKCHSDMQELFTLHDVREPDADSLKVIVDQAAERLTAHHGIAITPEAISTAIELTSKYRVRDMGLSRAQPERSVTLLDRALTSYRLQQHATAPGLNALEARLKQIDTGLAKGKFSGDLADKSPEEIENLRAAVESDIAQVKEDWTEFRGKLHSVYKEQRAGEEMIRELEDQLQTQRDREAEAAKEADAAKEAEQPESAVRGVAAFVGFKQRMNSAGFESETIRDIKNQIRNAEKAVAENKAKFNDLTADLNKDLKLDAALVLTEFSAISGIPADKLSENEREKLLHLEDSLKGRVFGQDEAVGRLADTVITSRIGKRRSDKPPSFMFIGPSGVGKTEISKALAEALMDDERALLQFDMSEYMEKHAVAKLIGAPPGYEGFDVGGILTNAMRTNPRRIILFDEIEKAHPDVFNIFLQILGDGRLTDNVGRTVSFGDSLVLMTSNLGQHNFLDKSMTPAEQFEKTMTEMKDHGLRPEFLNRFNGRENIVPFNTLTPEVIEMIVAREFKKINESYAEDGISLAMSPEAMTAFVAAKYNPEIGARGLPGIINRQVESKLARAILMNPDAKGTMQVTYDKDSESLEISPPKAPDVVNDNDKKAGMTTTPSASQAFKHS